MYSFEIWKDNVLCAKVCVDNENENIGYIGFCDNELNSILNIVVDAPYLITNTGDFKKTSYIGLEEKITIKDKRFLDVLKNQLFPYEIKNCLELKDTSIEEVLKQESPDNIRGE